MKKEKTIETKIDEELERQLEEIRVMESGTEGKTSAIKEFSEMYKCRSDAIERKNEERARWVDWVLRIGGKFVEGGIYVGLFCFGLAFEKDNALSSFFVKNHVNKLGRK